MTLLVLGEWCIFFRALICTGCISLAFEDFADLVNL